MSCKILINVLFYGVKRHRSDMLYTPVRSAAILREISFLPTDNKQTKKFGIPNEIKKNKSKLPPGQNQLTSYTWSFHSEFIFIS